MKFRDSIDVVDAFAADGLDFLAGPTDMKLETGFSMTEKPVWVTYNWGQLFATEFQLHSEFAAFGNTYTTGPFHNALLNWLKPSNGCCSGIGIWRRLSGSWGQSEKA